MRKKERQDMYQARLEDLIRRLKELEAAGVGEGAWFDPASAREFLEDRGLHCMLNRSKTSRAEQRRLAWAIAVANQQNLEAIHDFWGIWQELEGNDPSEDQSWNAFRTKH